MVADGKEVDRLLHTKDPLMGGSNNRGNNANNKGVGGSVGRLRRAVNTNNNSSSATRSERQRLTAAANAKATGRGRRR